MSLFARNVGNTIDFVGDPNTYLMNEFGWSLNSQREESIAGAIAKPDKFLSDRKVRMNRIFSDKVTPAYKKAFDELSPLGLPNEKLKYLAMRRAENAYNEELEIDNYRFPGWDRAIGKIENERDLLEDRGNNLSIKKAPVKRRVKKAAVKP